MSGPIEVEHEQVLYLVLRFSLQIERHKCRLNFLKLHFPKRSLKESKRKRERDLLSDSLTAREVMGGPGEKAVFRTPDLHLSPLTPRV